MIVKYQWDCRLGLYEGWFLLGIVPLYIRPWQQRF